MKLGWPIAILIVVLLVGGPLAGSHDESAGPSSSPGVDLAQVDDAGLSGPSTSDEPSSPTSSSTSTATAGPSLLAATGPTAGPTAGSTPAPTITVTAAPTKPPTAHPTTAPTAHPTTPPTAAPTAVPPPAGPIPPLTACAILPSSNVWNKRVDGLPVAADSATMIAAIGVGSSLHPDFSNGGGYGIPFNVVGASTPRSTVAFEYDDESDHVGYPIPASPQIEVGSDRHLLMIDTNACTLFELYAAAHGTGGWTAGSGAVWNLGSNDLRPAGWTSADAAGLPIFPGLVRYSEVAGGAINHAIRFTAPHTCEGYIYPATHEAGNGSACSVNPPMGLRVRLKSSVDISGFGPQAQVILVALQRYGMLLADNGSPWYITGAPDGHWNDDELHHLGQLTGADFEVVDTTGFVNG